MEEDSAPGRKAPAGRAFRNRAPRKTEAAKAGSSSRARAARFHELRTCKRLGLLRAWRRSGPLGLVKDGMLITTFFGPGTMERELER